MDVPALSIIIPAFNEARRLGHTLELVRAWVMRTGRSVELIVVDDGSTDTTAEIVRQHAAEPPAVQLLTNPVNRGKGYSVARGMLAARGARVLMCDADLSTPIEEIDKLWTWLDQGFDVVIASRDLPDSHLDPPQPRLRRWAAWLFRALRRRLLLPELRDTQCGFKLFTRAAAQAIFARQTLHGWLFDCEALGLAERLGYRVKEVGVIWRHRTHSRVRPLREALVAVPTLLAIRRRLARLEQTDRLHPGRGF